MLLALGLAWGIPELVVRLADPPLQSFRAIYFAGEPNSPTLFIQDPRLHWKLRPQTEVPFLGQVVRTDDDGFRNSPQPPAERLVLCLGDSTTFGWGLAQDKPFAPRLAQLLAGGSWRVVNAGVPGYSSFQVRLLAERLIPAWKPDVVVICLGNNEAWPVEQSDRELDEQRGAVVAVTSLLSHSKFLVWAAERVRAERPRPFMASALQDAEPRVSLAEFAQNIEQILQIARDHHARVILLCPPVNLYTPPPPHRVSQFVELAEWKAYLTQMNSLLQEKRYQEALDRVQQSLAADPDNFLALWCQGGVLLEMGRQAEARELFEQAFEKNPYPERCKRSYRELLRSTAARHQVPFLDLNALFHKATEPEPPTRLFQDWCHPTEEGHRLIAEALAPLVLHAAPAGEANEGLREDG